MNVEATYVGGAGLLIGSGPRWLLLTDPGDEAVVETLWETLTHPAQPGADVTEAVLAVVESAFGGEPPGLAMVDFSHGGSSSVSRGAGHVGISGPDRVLRLDGSAPDPDRAERRLIGGVVGAGQVRLRPVKAPGLPLSTPAAHGSPAPAPVGHLIDGIPEAILAAKGPEGPPPRPRKRTPDRTFEPTDTGALRDTTEPDPGMSLRIEEGGHTTIRPPVGSLPEPADGAGSHDGEADDGDTVHRPSHLEQESVPTVLAVSCPLGHLTPSASTTCRTCHQRIAPQEPRRVTRPVLGGLRLPTSEVVPLDRGVILGRKPAPVEGSSDWPHLVHLPSDHSFVSRMHLQIELDGWDVIARDLGSRGGTALLVPGRDPERMRAGEPYVLAPGTVLDLADVYAVRFETGPVSGR